MKTIKHTSLIKREAWIKRRIKTLRKWSLSSGSDFELLRAQENAHYGLIVYFGFSLVRNGIEDIFGAKSWYHWHFIVALSMLLFFIYLIYSVFRLRWALQAFEKFAPQMVDELSIKIAEQAAPSNR